MTCASLLLQHLEQCLMLAAWGMHVMGKLSATDLDRQHDDRAASSMKYVTLSAQAQLIAQRITI